MNYFRWLSSRSAPLESSAEHDDRTPAEIFSAERLEHYAENLARVQEVYRTGTLGISLRGRLRSNATTLNGAFHALITGIRKGDAVTPAAAWLVDNFYIIDEHIKAVRRDLPPGFYRQLPKLSNGPWRGYPRVYGLAVGLVTHTDNRFDVEVLQRYCLAYQRVQPLTIGELWAIAITLRVVLIENLRRLAVGIVSRLALREKADLLADQCVAETDDAMSPRPVESKPLARAFAAQLFQRLRDRDPKSTPVLDWLHRSLALQDTNADEMVHHELQRQGAVNVSVRNIITSLRLISSVDWAEFFESVSPVDTLLRRDSAYGSFDFSTRDLYRHAIEELARHSPHAELEVARRVLDAARPGANRTAGGRAGGAREGEPGFYLVGNARGLFEREIGYRAPLGQRLTRLTCKAGVLGYAGAIAVLSILMSAAVLLATASYGPPIWARVLFGLLGLVAASDVGITIVNLWVAQFCPPRPLAALELKGGVPAELRTVIVMPILLTSIAEIEEGVRGLEVHYLATQEGDIRFALLTDWLDADSEQAPGDEELLQAARAGIAHLNRSYGILDDGERFMLLQRRRVWNESQGRWMGWERKRGKLHEFNRLLAGSKQTTFIGIAGEAPKVPSAVRFVISLDADTRLPRGAALALIGKMAHPLNQPVLDPATRRVVAGYGILQPRVTPSLPAGHDASIFQRIFSGPSGMDPYAFAVSDVYQDMFGEGSYSGKGIYDVAAFEAALKDRVPQNRLLSHDLFEGIYARCGLASDVEVVEEFPSRYDVASSRQHRWTRGDWQLLPWVLRRDRSMSSLGRWKMFDNLRRSLIAPAVLLGLAVSWLAAAPVEWSYFLLATLALPVVLPFLNGWLPRLTELWRRGALRGARKEAGQAGLLILSRLVFLTDQAWVTADAIVRTLYRLTISRRFLLEWTTSAQAKISASLGLASFFSRMSGGLLLAIALGVAIGFEFHEIPWIALISLSAWLFAPLIARGISLPAEKVGGETLDAEQTRTYRLMGRQTWSYFDTFVTAEQNNLPPDNFQEIPTPVIANRTSPTNIGLYLLAVASARQFGWIGTRDAVDRLAATFATLDKLERFRGHFYNWYDTLDLRALDPKYISTVDSGNLAGHLLTLEGACRTWLAAPVSNQVQVNGVLDTLDHTLGIVRDLDAYNRRNYGVSPKQLSNALGALRVTLLSQMNAETVAWEAIEKEAANVCDICQALNDESAAAHERHLLEWARMLRASVQAHWRDLESGEQSDELAASIERLARRARQFALEMEFGFLLQPERQLLSIGYRVADRAQDPSCYDLLASEARLASFIAIAKSDLPMRHWFRLGRRLTTVDTSAALVSWSGSMFEYLMPILVMREPDGSVLGQTARMVVRRQISYGIERGLPWGVSESAFNARDRGFTYQYLSFGVPGLGLQRGLGDEAVVAPYATGLAAMIDPRAALRNFERLKALGGRGPYGWYDALDFTPSRLPEGATVAVVRAYMAHHQGMVLASIANLLNDGLLRTYFHSNSLVQATELLLQEKTPRDVELARSGIDEMQSAPAPRELTAVTPRRFTSPHHAAPRTHVLSNGNYSVMLTVAGSGYSRLRDVAVTRWREDPTCDPWGSYIFLRDVVSGQVWSAGYQPAGVEPDSYEVAFFEDHAEFVRRDGSLMTATEMLVSSEDDAEVRRVSVTNEGNRVREIEITTYAEVVLTTPDADGAHPAFAKLFVETEFIAESGALLATRRRRDPSEPELWAAMVSAVEGETVGGLQFETDRARFLGRGRNLRDAVSIIDARPLSGTVGTVLDSVLSLRRRVRILPGQTARVAFWTGVTETRVAALAQVDKHRDMGSFERAKTLAWTQAQVQLRYLGVDFDEAQDFQRVANRVLYADSALRAGPEILESNVLGQSALWPCGISGDIPIVLVKIDSEQDIEIVRQLLRAHEYWRLKRLAVDLVILNELPPSYASNLQQALETAIRSAQFRREEVGGLRGAVFALRADLVPAPTLGLLQTAARAIFVARQGSLSDQLARVREARPEPRRLRRNTDEGSSFDYQRATAPLEFFNGLGGFAERQREYVVLLDENQWTPAPWTNVIANPTFGFMVSADGAGSTWWQNAQQNRLTPWSNDPVSNSPSEAIYIRDDETGDLWTATPLPIRQTAHSYTVRHGFGYSRFEHSSHGISLDLQQFVPRHDSIKISRLKIANRSATTRGLTISNYLEWVLGTQLSKTAAFVVTEIEPATQALFARNPWSAEYHEQIGFLDMAGRQQSCTGDRSEFLGRHGSLAEPAALLTPRPLSGRVGAGLDPCGAMQTTVTLQPDEEIEISFFLGAARSREAAVDLIERYRGADLDAVLREVSDFWRATLNTVQVHTPDRSMDILLNGWLLYQTLVCRVWARAGFYQSSGAYGFRDQLQDVMALCVSAPSIAREHILRAAGRQFTEGDVQHWWLPASGQGVRTRVSDDRAWLAFVTAHYVEVSADFAILDESVPFLAGEPLPADAHERFSTPGIGPAASLYEHCVRALDSSMTIGSHGLPLFGAGDWNDGMNRVGAEGRGESVWLAWFLYASLMRFASVADKRADESSAVRWRKQAFALQRAVEREAWDGDWYRRGYFDDGTPLGSVSNDECRIDSIAQSWGVISGAADAERKVRSMAAVDAQLVSRSEGLVHLFTPPFNRTAHDPGYIKAYPPGLRENGGQYTHAAIWSVLAFALMGDGDRAGELFSLINPINHASNRAGIYRYKVEPYVACADVYSAPSHIGRGGWTWYTGSAAWMYRTALEGLLGATMRGDVLSMNPCIARGWSGFELSYERGASRYRITVENPRSVSRGLTHASIDGVEISSAPCDIRLLDDGRNHEVHLVMG